jgi:hypothetical protein
MPQIPIPPVGDTNAATSTYRGSFDAASKINADATVGAEKNGTVENKSPSEPTKAPAQYGVTERHYDDASTRPSIPVSPI